MAMGNMPRQGMAAEGAADGGAGAEEAGKFRFMGNGEEVLLTDIQARQRITELEARVAELEAQPQIWTGTDAQYEADNAAGKIREGSIIISIEEESGTGQGEEAQASTGGQEGGGQP